MCSLTLTNFSLWMANFSDAFPCNHNRFSFPRPLHTFEQRNTFDFSTRPTSDCQLIAGQPKE